LKSRSDGLLEVSAFLHGLLELAGIGDAALNVGEVFLLEIF
jgi:hypothetical protein